MKKVTIAVLLAAATALLQSMDAIGFNKNLYNVNDNPEKKETDKSPTIDPPDSTKPPNDIKQTYPTISDLPTPGQSDTAIPISQSLPSVTPLMKKLLKQKYNFSLLSNVPVLYPSNKVQPPSRSSIKLPSSMALNVTLPLSILKNKRPPYKYLPNVEKIQIAAENGLLSNYTILSSEIPYDKLPPLGNQSITSTPGVLNNKTLASEVLELRQKTNKNVSSFVDAFSPSPSYEIPTSYDQSSTDTLFTENLTFTVGFPSSLSNVGLFPPTSDDNSPLNITTNKKRLSIQTISKDELSNSEGSFPSTPVKAILPPSDKSRLDTSNSEITQFKLWPMEESIYEQLEFGETSIENLKNYSPALSNQSSLNTLNNKITPHNCFSAEKGKNEYIKLTETFSLSTHEILSSTAPSVSLTPDMSNNEPLEFNQKLNSNLLNSTDALPTSQISSEQLNSNIP